MEVDTAPSTPQRDPELWFEDGNLVLQAGNSQFRVYRGILAARSPIFQDMLSFPQPPDSEMVDGCPLVRLPDAENEVSEFLKAIFIPEYFLPFPALTKFDIIVGCLRLSHKYEVDYLRRRALIHLSSRYRTTLSEWDSGLNSYSYSCSSDLSPLRLISWMWPDDDTFQICVIQLAREVDALWLLPTAFYDLSSSFNNAWHGGGLGREIFHSAVYNGTPTSLSVQDQDCFLQGHTIQTRATTRDIVKFLFYPPDIEGCTSSACSGNRLNRLRVEWDDLHDNSPPPLDVWVEDDWESLEEDVCRTCIAVLRRTHAEARQAFWDALPEMYGLPPWEELKKMKAAAIGNDVFSP
ncbi:hypothetical protein FB451DRAFT_1153424 [Mycena latifolia]|nr:hypothetical protein FB451DRAFT_1153424 [Mycena latifolia]